MVLSRHLLFIEKPLINLLSIQPPANFKKNIEKSRGRVNLIESTSDVFVYRKNGRLEQGAGRFFPSLPCTPKMVCALPGSKSILSTVQARLPSYMKH